MERFESQRESPSGQFATETGRSFHKGESVPTLNAFIKLTLQKGETGTYADSIETLVNMKSRGKATSSSEAWNSSPGSLADDPKAKEVERSLGRLLQHGHLMIASIRPILTTLKAAETLKTKEDRSIVRFIYLLVQLALGDGSAGTPIPTPVSHCSRTLPKAVDQYGPEVLSASWADLSDDKSPFMHKQGALRTLAALARASFSSHPDDPTYIGGLLVTLQSMLDSLDQIRARSGALAQSGSQPSSTSKASIAEFRARMEVWALMRSAFSAARVALPRSYLTKITPRSFAGVCSSDPACARHALALASLVARDPQTGRVYINELGPALTRSLELARAGRPWGRPPRTDPSTSTTGPSPASTIGHEGLNLKDTWSRVYLARGCASVIQSGHIAGDIGGRGEVYWQSLLLLSLSDPSDLVAMEAIKAMFGAPLPKAEPSIRRRGQGQVDIESEAMQARIFGASWNMIMSVADDAVPHETVPDYDNLMSTEGGKKGATLFDRLAARLLKGCRSARRPLVSASCRAIAVIAESRAWCSAMTGRVGQDVETESVRRHLNRFISTMQSIAFDSPLGSCEKEAAVEALFWLQDHPPPSSPSHTLLTPGQLLKCMTTGGGAALNVVRVLYADPWTDGSCSSLLSSVSRCLRCHLMDTSKVVENERVGGWALDLASAACAACPSRTAAISCASSILSSPHPPISQPHSLAPVEVKLLAAQEETAYEGLRCMAAWWLGENGNFLSGLSCWQPPLLKSLHPAPPSSSSATTTYKGYPPPSPSTTLQPQPLTQGVGLPLPLPSGLKEVTQDPAERMALAGNANGSILSMIISHLQRALVAGSWELRCVAAQALAKVAVRSREPYRITCYSALAATQAHHPSHRKLSELSSFAPCDPFIDYSGLAAVVRPALEVLDLIYGGQVVLETYASAYGREAQGWTKQALASLKRRHEHLTFLVQQRIGFVPKDVYYPLGPLSKRLLKPEEPLDEEEAEEDVEMAWIMEQEVNQRGPGGGGEGSSGGPKGLPKNILEAAKAAAALAMATSHKPISRAPSLSPSPGPAPAPAPSSYSYDQQHYDYDQQGGAYDESYYEGQDYYEGAEGGGGQGSYYYGDGQGGGGGEGASPFAAAVALRIPGLEDGGAGSVYSSSIVGDDEDFRWATSQYGFAAEGTDEVTVHAGERLKVFADMGDWYHVTVVSKTGANTGRSGLVPASYVRFDESHSSQSTPSVRKGGGGGGRQISEQLSMVSRADSNASSYVAAAGGGGYYGGGDGDYGEEAYGSYGQAPEVQYYQNASLYDEEEEGRGDVGGGGGFDDFGSALAAFSRQPQQPQQQPLPQQPQYSQQPQQYSQQLSDSSSYQDPQFYPSSYQQQASSSAMTPPSSYPAQVLYDFVAEAENELSVRAGEEVEVGAEVDGWYQTTRVRDGVSGLVPASYVQMMQ